VDRERKSGSPSYVQGPATGKGEGRVLSAMLIQRRTREEKKKVYPATRLRPRSHPRKEGVRVWGGSHVAGLAHTWRLKFTWLNAEWICSAGVMIRYNMVFSKREVRTLRFTTSLGEKISKLSFNLCFVPSRRTEMSLVRISWKLLQTVFMIRTTAEHVGKVV
jgi:hypothetical protein